MYLAGVDIGGTKCAACIGRADGEQVEVLCRAVPRAPREYTPAGMLEALAGDLRDCLAALPAWERAEGIGISCGGPLDSRAGIVLSPPNLPGWDAVPAAKILSERTGLPAWLCNDANAGALAEWQYGAGRGCRDLVFLTFGTGLGAGLILGGRLYEGASGMAGELGHIRLDAHGPVGYGKAGSFEGFCSGGGIAQLARAFALEELQAGKSPALCPDMAALAALDARRVGEAAAAGDPLARKILREAGTQLGRGLSIIIDMMNPKKIVIGSIFARCYNEIWPAAREVLEREALPAARAVCEVLPSALSESVGDIAALSVARYHIKTAEEPV